jgi:hypothetical protein
MMTGDENAQGDELGTEEIPSYSDLRWRAIGVLHRAKEEKSGQCADHKK